MCWKPLDKTHEKIIMRTNLKRLFSYTVFFLIILFIDFSVLLLDGGKGGFAPEIQTEHTRQLESQYDQIKYFIVMTVAIIIILCLIGWILYWLLYNLYLHFRIKKKIIKYENVTEEFIQWAYDNKIYVSQDDKFKVFSPLKWSTKKHNQYFCIMNPSFYNPKYKYQFFRYNKT